MEQYLIDTNILSYYLSGRLNDKGVELMDELVGSRLNISVITKIELLSWKTSDTNQSIIRDLLKDSNVINITDDIVERCVKVRLEKGLKIPDAIIASTALSLSHTLITANQADFFKISNLRIINPGHL